MGKKRVSGVILAGGQSSRMGCNKAELELHGMSFLQHQICKLRAIGVEDILISGYSKPVEGTRFAPDIIADCGPLSGIHAGLLAAKNEASLVLGVDVPLLPAEFLERLLQAHLGGISILEQSGEIEPLIGVYDKGLAALCERLLREKDFSVRSLLKLAGFRTLRYEGDERLLLNCNTPEEYRTLLGIEI